MNEEAETAQDAPEATEVVVRRDVLGRVVETVTPEAEEARDHWAAQLWRRMG